MPVSNPFSLFKFADAIISHSTDIAHAHPIFDDISSTISPFQGGTFSVSDFQSAFPPDTIISTELVSLLSFSFANEIIV